MTRSLSYQASVLMALLPRKCVKHLNSTYEHTHNVCTAGRFGYRRTRALHRAPVGKARGPCPGPLTGCYVQDLWGGHMGWGWPSQNARTPSCLPHCADGNWSAGRGLGVPHGAEPTLSIWDLSFLQSSSSQNVVLGPAASTSLESL